MIDKTDAGGDAYFLETHSLGKLTNLLDTRPLAVARCLDHGRGLGDAANFRIVVFTRRVVDAVWIHLCRAIPGTTFSRFTHATGAHIVRAICACRIFILHTVSPASGLGDIQNSAATNAPICRVHIDFNQRGPSARHVCIMFGRRLACAFDRCY